MVRGGQWRPGKVNLSKITTRFPYLVATGFAPPPPDDTPPNGLKHTITNPRQRQPNKISLKWARRLTQRRALQTAKQLDNNAIDEAIQQAMLDSGASKTFVNTHNGMELTGVSDKVIVTADGTEVPATNTALIPLPALSKGARQAIVVPGLKQKALLSVGTLADNGYTTIFLPGKQGVDIYKNTDVTISATRPPLLQGCRDHRGLWMVPMGDTQDVSPGLDVAETALNVYELPSTKEVVRFLHAALGYPTKATLLTAAQRGNLVTFPGLTPENINRHFPESDETQKGHMRQTRQGVRSTKVIDEDALLGAQIQPGVKHKDVYLRVFDATKKPMYSDQTGRFPITSARGNKYIMVAVELDGNYIDAEPVKSRKAKELTKHTKRFFDDGSPRPEELKQAIRENKCRVELTPADMHRRNIAERGIQTFKGHFISVLAGVANNFPINQWDELLPQMVLTLNLLRQANVSPNISAWAYHHGSFDYNRMPLAPWVREVQFHVKPSRRKTFGEHSGDGFYLKTSDEHYRTHVIFVKKTRAKRLADTVFFKHRYITQPTVTTADAIVNAYRKLQQAITGIQHSRDNAQMEAIERIQRAFDAANNQVHKQNEPIELTRTEQTKGTDLAQPVPRVTFEAHTPPSRMIVASPKEPVVVSPEKTVVPKPPTTPAKPTTPNDSIAFRTRSKRQPQPEPIPHESIADRVARRRREMEAAHAVLDQETGQLLEYRQLLKHPKFRDVWNRSASDEFGRLAQGIGGRIKGTDTIRFIHKHEIPQDRFKDVTYIKFVCTIRTEKKDPYRTRATMGGNLINYPDDVGTPTANLLLIKIFLNSVISTKGARFAGADIANFYLMTPLTRPEYAKIRLSDIPEEVITEYNLREYATADGWVYIKVVRGMYGLPQSGSLGHDLLESRLNQEGYYQSKIVPGLWRHKTRPIQFVLVVDDFGIKYIQKSDLDHLVHALQKYYDVTVDLEGKEYVKIELDWDYANKKVHLSMAPYLQKALRQFDNIVPTQRHDSPYPYIEPKYGAKQQFAEYDQSAPVGEKEQKYVQQVTGKFNWYARGVDGTLLTPISALTAQQAKPTQATMKRVQQFLDYAATQEPAVTTYRAAIWSWRFTAMPGTSTRQMREAELEGTIFFRRTSQTHRTTAQSTTKRPSSKRSCRRAAGEMGALYTNARKGVEIRNILEEMGHKQPPTLIQTDNSTAEGIVNSRVQPKRTKAMDMRFHWLRDCAVNQGQFRFYWRPGTLQRGDYWTKHHSPTHHRQMRHEILSPYKVVTDLRTRIKRTKGDS
eukprot:CCRYP_014884-RA/>CCRYP_014884-RA protein AED:0.24 eAED:0.24 QI:0/0/0/0.75/0.33/0/4/0/1279